MATEQNFEDLEKLVAWATTPAQSGLRLNGWGALVSYSVQPLNISWEILRATPSPPESLEAIQGVFSISEDTYIHHFSTLGRPTLKFNTSNSSPDSAILFRRIEKSLDFAFSGQSIPARRLLHSIKGSFSGAQYLNIEAEHPTFSYSAQKNVEFEWNNANYTLSPPGNDDEVKREIYAMYYSANPTQKTAVLGSFVPAQVGIIKPPLSFRTYTDSPTGQVIAYVALSQNGGIPVDPHPMLVYGKAATALIDRRASPAGIPADMGQLPQLLAPHQQISMNAASTASPKDHVAIYNPANFSGTLTETKSSKFDVHPLSSLVNPQQEIELKVSPEPVSVNWTLQSGSQGSLSRRDGKLFYQAPARSAPGARSSVDVASATIEGLRYESVFVTTYEPQIGYFKFSKSDSRVLIQLCMTDRAGNERIISADDTEWTILHGNGSVDQQGTFTPDGQAASPFTVIQAVEKFDPASIWACVMLPVPLLSVDDAVSMFNS